MIKLTDGEFRQLVDFVKGNYGINLTQKRVLLEGRLANYLADRGFTDFSGYIRVLEADRTGQEVTTLLNKVTTNHTYFMREADHFDYFRDRVLPYWEPRIADRDFRIWCAASSTGEEPYTLAMILQDYFGGKIPPWDKALLASDLSERVLEMAQNGVYSLESIKNIPAAWKNKYFQKYDAEQVRVVEKLRKEIVYRKFNLMDPISARRPFHVIFCRNVMIYFDAPTKAALVERMYDVMAPGGFLFVGHTESVARPTRFNYVMPSVYQKGG
jgi:chemotaxis protein methyltransferase CheR